MSVRCVRRDEMETLTTRETGAADDTATETSTANDTGAQVEDPIPDTCLKCVQADSDVPPVCVQGILAACEVCIVVCVAVVFGALSVNYTVNVAHGYDGPMLHALLSLSVLGAGVVDVVSFYFILKGYTACAAIEAVLSASEDGPSQYIYCKAVFRLVFPDLLISTLLYCLLHGILCMSGATGSGCMWSWLNLGLAPCLLSPFVDVNPDNTYRAVNEMLWIVQVHTLFLLSSYLWFNVTRQLVVRIVSWDRLVYVLVSLWVGTFAQLYVVAVYPFFINIMTQNIFTSSVFFITGMVVRFVSSPSDDLRPFQSTVRSTVGYLMLFPRHITVTLYVWVVFGYLHHLFPYSDAAPCVSVFSGRPCLWAFDICTARLLPLQALCMLWLTDIGALFENYFFGSIPVSITTVLQCTITKVASYCLTILFYSEFMLFGVHTIMVSVLQRMVTSCVHLIVPFEVVLVLVLCFYLSDVSKVLLGGIFDHLSDYVCTRVFDPWVVSCGLCAKQAGKSETAGVATHV